MFSNAGIGLSFLIPLVIVAIVLLALYWVIRKAVRDALRDHETRSNRPPSEGTLR
jgi:membrane protein implicated in regulation of membrane protease activity